MIKPISPIPNDQQADFAHCRWGGNVGVVSEHHAEIDDPENDREPITVS
jgi:hypothetical protein